MLAQTVATPEIPWSLIRPLLFFAEGAVILVTLTALFPRLRTKSFPAYYTAAMAIGSLVFLVPIWRRIEDDGPQLILDGALAVDGFAVFVSAVISIAVLFTALFLDDYLRREGLDGPEWYVLVLLSASGGLMMAAAEDLIVTFLGLEILSIAVYVLAALHLRRSESQEAGFKYFILGALSSAFFLYGIALVYGATGSTRLNEIAAALSPADNGRLLNPIEDSSMILAGMAFLLVGFGFKVSAAPFHLWTPDVYEGAPTPVVGFMASAVKVAGFAGFARVFLSAFAPTGADWRPVIGAMALLSIVIGSFLAIKQNNVKRMLAYSSISHAGFILIGLHAAGSTDRGVAVLGSRSVLFYLFAYTFMVLGSFGIATLIGRQGDGAHDLSDYAGLSSRKPLLAALLVVLMFAQAGIPFTSGFWAKFGVIEAAVRGENYILAAAAMVAAVVGAYLYLKVTVSMFLTEPETDEDGVAVVQSGGTIAMAPAATLAIVAAVAATILWGVLPDLGGDILREASTTFLR